MSFIYRSLMRIWKTTGHILHGKNFLQLLRRVPKKSQLVDQRSSDALWLAAALSISSNVFSFRVHQNTFLYSFFPKRTAKAWAFANVGEHFLTNIRGVFDEDSVERPHIANASRFLVPPIIWLLMKWYQALNGNDFFRISSTSEDFAKQTLGKSIKSYFTLKLGPDYSNGTLCGPFQFPKFFSKPSALSCLELLS